MHIKYQRNDSSAEASVSFNSQNSMDDVIIEAMDSIDFIQTVFDFAREEYKKKSFRTRIHRLGRKGMRIEEVGPFLAGLLTKYFKKYPEVNDEWFDHIAEQIDNDSAYLIEQVGKTFIFLITLALEALAGYSFTDIYYARYDELNE